MMEAWQQRVVEEKKELDEKLEKLRDFLKSKAFLKLRAEDDIAASLLVEQELAMTTYSFVLKDRIEHFK